MIAGFLLHFPRSTSFLVELERHQKQNIQRTCDVLGVSELYRIPYFTASHEIGQAEGILSP